MFEKYQWTSPLEYAQAPEHAASSFFCVSLQGDTRRGRPWRSGALWLIDVILSYGTFPHRTTNRTTRINGGGEAQRYFRFI